MLLLFGADAGPENLAQGKPTLQNSIGWDGESDRAVDGDSNGRYWQGSCSHTNVDEPWWSVDLGDSYEVTSVTISNREDCCGK